MVYIRSHPCFDDLLCDRGQAVFVGLLIAVEHREIETIGSVDLDVNEARTAQEFSNCNSRSRGATSGYFHPGLRLCQAFLFCHKRFAIMRISMRGQERRNSYLSIQNDPPCLVNPEVLLKQSPILLREETVGEADETVGRGHWPTHGASAALYSIPVARDMRLRIQPFFGVTCLKQLARMCAAGTKVISAKAATRRK